MLLPLAEEPSLNCADPAEFGVPLNDRQMVYFADVFAGLISA